MYRSQFFSLKFLQPCRACLIKPTTDNACTDTNKCFVSSLPRNGSQKDLVTMEQMKTTRVISINRPEKKNCVNVATANSLLQAFEDFDSDDNSEVAVLHGVGGNFCAGFDLKELSSTPDIISKLDPTKGPMGPTRLQTKKPVIAAVEGYAVAGGLELALWCDVRIVADDAIMGVFCRRFGVPLIDGGTVRLPTVVGLGRALDLILTGRPVHADEALKIGLATQICASGLALDQALNYAESIHKNKQLQDLLRTNRNPGHYALFPSPQKIGRENDIGISH